LPVDVFGAHSAEPEETSCHLLRNSKNNFRVFVKLECGGVRLWCGAEVGLLVQWRVEKGMKVAPDLRYQSTFQDPRFWERVNLTLASNSLVD
jgi:hypothetical protein